MTIQKALFILCYHGYLAISPKLVAVSPCLLAIPEIFMAIHLGHPRFLRFYQRYLKGYPRFPGFYQRFARAYPRFTMHSPYLVVLLIHSTWMIFRITRTSCRAHIVFHHLYHLGEWQKEHLHCLLF